MQRITEESTLVIAQNDLVCSNFLHVIRIYRNLSSTSGSINHKLRNRIPGGISPQRADDFHTFLDRCAKVGTSRDQIALIEIIRSNPHHQEAVNQRFVSLWIVIHAIQKYGLVPDWRARKRKFLASFVKLLGAFLWVIDMDAQPDRPMFP